MKVREIIDTFSKYSSEEDVAIKWYDKDEIELNLEVGLSSTNWKLICKGFEENKDIDNFALTYLEEAGEVYDGDSGCNFCHELECVGCS